MSPLPELNLNLGMSKDPDFPFNEMGKEEIIIRTDSALRKYTISLTISDQEAGTIILQINGNEIEVPTYKLIVTDDKTEEIRSYQVTRDILRFVKTKNKKVGCHSSDLKSLIKRLISTKIFRLSRNRTALKHSIFQHTENYLTICCFTSWKEAGIRW